MAKAEMKTFKSINTKAFRDLLILAKGPNRTGKEFCDECGISTSAFSRYLKEQNTRPAGTDFLKKIVDHADPNSGITYALLLEANGGLTAEAAELFVSFTDSDIIGLITSSILLHNYQCQLSVNRNLTDIMGLSYRPSWSILSTAIDGITPKTWDFYFWKTCSKSVELEADRMIRQLLIILSAVNLGYIEFDKLSFVLFDNNLYDSIIDRTKSLKCRLNISLLLISSQKQIIAEHQISGESINGCSIVSQSDPVDTIRSSLLYIDEQNIL